MPRLPSYRLHKASGKAVIQWRPLFGKNPHYLPGAYGSPESIEAYEKIRAEILASIHKAPKPPPKPTKHATVNSLLYAFLHEAEAYYANQVEEFNHYRRMAKIVKRMYGTTKVSQFGPLALKAVREEMIKKGWTRKGINHQINRVRRIFRWGVSNEWVDVLVLNSLEAVEGLRAGKTKAPESKPVEPVEWAPVERVLPCVSPIVAAMIRLQWLSAMRSDELTGLRACEIDMRGDVWVYKPSEHKTAHLGKKKIICFGPLAQELIRPYLTDDPEAYLFSPAIALEQQRAARLAARKTPKYGEEKRKRPKRRLTNSRYDTRGYQHAINHGFRKLANSIEPRRRAKKGEGRKKPEKLPELLKRLGVVHWHPHQLRHSRATLTRDAYGIEGAQAQTGNTLDATQIYAEKSLNLAKRIARETG